MSTTTSSVELANWIFPAFVLFVLGSIRCGSSNKASSDSWYTLAHWVRSAKKSRIGKQVSFTKSQDRSMRMCSINHTVMRNGQVTDKTLEAYLDVEIQSQYMNVQFSGIRSKTGNPEKALFWKCFFYFYADLFLEQYDRYKHYRDQAQAVQYHRREMVECFVVAFCTGVITFILGPWYFLSRFLNVLFPVFIIVYLYLNDGIILWSPQSFDSIDMFQSVMISIHIVLTAVVFVLFCVNADEHYLMHHMIPWGDLFHRTKPNAEKLLQQITDHYYYVVVVPVRKAMVLDMFGADIGPIILSFLPIEDHFEDGAQKVVMVSTV